MNIKCDYCKLRAIVNYQKTWVKYRITKDGKYKLNPNFNGLDVEDIKINENFHLCEKHEKDWAKGKI